MIDIVVLNQTVVTEYSVRLFGEIGEISEYVELLDLLSSAEEHDAIKLIVSGPGGHFETAVAIANAIKACAAPVCGELLGTAASASAMILLACDTIEVAPASRLMLHIYSGGSAGVGLNPQKDMVSVHAMFKEYMYEYCLGYMTKEEIDALEVNNSDIFHNTEEIRARIMSLYQHRLSNNKGKPCIQYLEGSPDES